MPNEFSGQSWSNLGPSQIRVQNLTARNAIRLLSLYGLHEQQQMKSDYIIRFVNVEKKEILLSNILVHFHQGR